MQGAAERTGWGKWVLASIGIAVVGGVITVLIEYSVFQPGFAPKAEAWTTNLTPADSGGVTAWGEVQRAKDGLIHLTGKVKDNKKDGKGAVLIIRVDHGSRTEERRELHTQGFNRSIDIGGSPNGHSFLSSIKSISVQECLTTRTDASKSDPPKDCGSDSKPAQIWNADRP